ncbi:MAG: tRNA-dihydrouridine synthase [Nocardioides sp.]|jgi:dihydroorotate dehydrogenase (NAD+) catalytic subunit
MTVPVAGLRLRSRVMVASGCGGTGRELQPYVDLSRLGAFVTRSITRDPRPGGRQPRIVETPSGLLNAVAFDNPGLDRFLMAQLPWLVQQGAHPIVSIAGATIVEYAEIAKRLAAAPGVLAVEVNLSAPDPRACGIYEAREPFHTAGVVAAVLRELPPGVPVFAKVRSDVVRVVEVARTVIEAGASAVVVGNALPAALPDGRGAGLSGPAIGPIALRCVAEVCAALPDIDVIGCGGIASTADARAFLDAGACGVQVGSALLHDPTTLARILDELEN